MADVSLTAADIRPLNGATVRRYDAGGTLTPGQPVYIHTDGTVKAGDADALATAQGRGVVVSDGQGSTSFASGTRVDVVTAGPVTGFSGAVDRAHLVSTLDFTPALLAAAALPPLPGMHGDQLRPVALKPEHHLGGLLTHGSVLIGNGTGTAPHPRRRR